MKPTNLRQILREAYTCSRCPKKFGFSISPNGSYYKFPPLIGANGQADILFVGINPRRSFSNHDLHDELMAKKQAFADLASNQFNGEAYIHADSAEGHYHDHLEIIRRVCGKNRPFESCAAVTELFLCATQNSGSLPNSESPCADDFLPKVLDIVQPKVIVAVGERVMRYFKTKPTIHQADDALMVNLVGRDFPVVKMPHPGDPNLSPAQRHAAIKVCASVLRRHLAEQQLIELVESVKDAWHEFKAGQCCPSHAEQIIQKLRS